MICPEEGLLQRYIDNETDLEEKKYVEKHLQNCDCCSAAFKELKDSDDFTYDIMSRYKQYVNQYYSSAKVKADKSIYSGCDYGDIKANNQIKERMGEFFMPYFKKYKKIAAGFCAIVLVILCVNVLPVDTAVADFLSIFRAEHIKGINLTAKDIQEIQNELKNSKPEIDLKKFGKIEILGGTQKPVTISETKDFKNFPVLLPSDVTTAILEITNVDPQFMSFTLNVDYVNDVLKFFGSTYLLPVGIDQKTFTLNIPRRISMKYKFNGNDIYIVQTTTPELVVPEGVEADVIYNSLLKLPIIPDNLQRQLQSIKDWKNTIYIPVTGAETKEVDIRGAKGYTGSKTDEDGKVHSAVIWSDNGIIRTIEGDISSEEIVEIARSMK